MNDAPLFEDFSKPTLDPRLSWRCEPESWRIDSSAKRLRLNPDAGTDFWQRTHYGFEVDNGHLLFLEAAGDFGRGLETTAGLAGAASEQLLRRRALADLQRVPDELLAVDPARVRAFAGEVWQPDALRTVIVADLKAAGADLPAQFPGAWIVRAAELDLGSATLRKAGRR